MTNHLAKYKESFHLSALLPISLYAGMLALGQSKGNTVGLTNISTRSDHFENYHCDPASPDFFHSGGGGLVGTCADYLRFAQCMLDGGKLDQTRILGRKTVQTMVRNQLGRNPRSGLHRDVSMMTPGSGYSEASADSGFGLGFSVVVRDEAATHLTSTGTFSWGGAGSTMFWCDPEEDMVVVFATQLRFRDDFELPLNALLHNLVYSCLADGKVGHRARL